jgi:hypothetical protein
MKRKPFWETNKNPITMQITSSRDSDYHKKQYNKKKKK